MAKIPGYVYKVRVDMGDRVLGPRFDDDGTLIEPGQVLAELWVPEIEEELQEKKARVDQAAAELKLAQESVKAAEAELAQQKSQYERFVKDETGVFNKQIVEETRYAYELSKAKSGMAAAEVGVRTTRVEVAKAEERRLRALLDYSRIRAPYNGVIVRRNVHTGHYLTSGDAKPLFVIARTDIVRVIVDVPEVDAMCVSDGVPALIRCPTLKNQEFPGKVTRSSWSLDAKSRTLRTEVELRNPDNTLRPGMYAYGRIDGCSPEAWVVPAAALVKQGDMTSCFMIEAGKAVRVPVQVGRSDSGFVEVLKQQRDGRTWADFTGNEEIVASSSASLRDGEAVRIVSAKEK